MSYFLYHSTLLQTYLHSDISLEGLTRSQHPMRPKKTVFFKFYSIQCLDRAVWNGFKNPYHSTGQNESSSTFHCDHSINTIRAEAGNWEKLQCIHYIHNIYPQDRNVYHLAQSKGMKCVTTHFIREERCMAEELNSLRPWRFKATHSKAQTQENAPD